MQFGFDWADFYTINTQTMKQFSNLRELISYFSTEDHARQYLEQKRWNNIPTCPKCSCQKAYRLTRTKSYRCANKHCQKTFSVTIGTIFENSNVSLVNWFIAIYLLTAHKKGISSYQLGKDIGVTQATAWFMLHRIRHALKRKKYDEMCGIVEADETFVGGKNKNRHWDKKVKYSQGRSFKDKTPVLGLLQRGGHVRCIVVKNTRAYTIQPLVMEHVSTDATLMTDEWKAYRGLHVAYNHYFVDHGRGQYAVGDCYTNSLENFWSILKRGIIGIYHKVTRKHLQRYCDEFTYRFNLRQVNDSERFEATFQDVACRLTYKDLVAA